MYIPSSRSDVRIMRGERNSKAGKPCFTGLDIAEPKLILCKDNANERKESVLSVSRVQLILCKDTQISLFSPSPLCIITTSE